MNYLLDTPTLIWVISEKERLSHRVIRIFSDSANTFFVSAISFWEIALKFSRGKLEIEGIFPEEVPNLAIQSGFKLIPLLPDESATFSRLIVTTHKDPFDRMLIWQAIQRNLTFITIDDQLAQYEIAGLKTLW